MSEGKRVGGFDEKEGAKYQRWVQRRNLEERVQSKVYEGSAGKNRFKIQRGISYHKTYDYQ
ncbi:MAG TPA: hypothetical protein VF233_00350 [Nitrososphaeraceae archaeon]